MPVIPPGTSAPYDSAGTVLNFTRAICNDAALSIDGNLLSDEQPYTFTFLNSAWRDLQDELMDNGVETFPSESILEDVTAVASADPAVQTYIGYDGYFDGVTLNSAPMLPSDMVIPLRTWERLSNSTNVFVPMYPVTESLPSRPKNIRLYEWEWRDDRIYMVGATQSNDMRLRYNRYLDDIASDSEAKIPIMRCAKALAYFVAAEFANSRGSPLAATFTQKGAEAVQKMVSRSARKQQRINRRRQPYSGGSRSGFRAW